MSELFMRIAIFLGVVEKVDYGIMGCYLFSKEIEAVDDDNFLLIKGFAVSCFNDYSFSESSASLLLANTVETDIKELSDDILVDVLTKLLVSEKKLNYVFNQEMLINFKHTKILFEHIPLVEQTELLRKELYSFNFETYHFSDDDMEWISNYLYDGLQFNLSHFSFGDFPSSILRKLNKDKRGNLLESFFCTMYSPLVNGESRGKKRINDYLSESTMKTLVDLSFDQISITELEKNTGIPLHNFNEHFNDILVYLYVAITNDVSKAEIDHNVSALYNKRKHSVNNNPELYN